ncbi:MAG: hypothetical protein M1281_07750 [Chloroflexi bacterium]|nr:hypothetical protein [Chloroflexota bacterium]
MKQSRLLLVALMSVFMVILAACSSVPAGSIPPTGGTPTGGTPTTYPATAAPTPIPTAVTPSTPATTPPASSDLVVTLQDNHQTIHLQVGQTFLLKLGDGFNWNVTVADQSVVSRVVNILVVRGAQGVYKAHQAGSTTLTAVGDPLCRQATPACAAPSILFKIQIEVS